MCSLWGLPYKQNLPILRVCGKIIIIFLYWVLANCYFALKLNNVIFHHQAFSLTMQFLPIFEQLLIKIHDLGSAGISVDHMYIQLQLHDNNYSLHGYY